MFKLLAIGMGALALGGCSALNGALEGAPEVPEVALNWLIELAGYLGGFLIDLLLGALGL